MKQKRYICHIYNVRYIVISLLLVAVVSVSCKSNSTDVSPSENDSIVDNPDTGYVSPTHVFSNVLSLEEFEAMDSLEKISYYYSLTDSIPDVWKTRDINATSYAEEVAIPTLPTDEVIYLHYNQKVHGYRVWVEYKQAYSDLNFGRSILHFTKSGHSFDVYCDAFSDNQLSADETYKVNNRNTINLSEIKPGSHIKLNYTRPKANEYLSSSSPFYFKDMDFDGEEELVVNILGMGARGYYNEYDIYKVFNVSKPLKLKGLPFTNDSYKITNYNVEYEPKTMSVLDKRYDGFDAYGYYRYKSIPASELKNLNLNRAFILEEAMNMGFYHLKNRQASDSINNIQPYKKFKRINGKMVLIERGIYESGNYGWNNRWIVLEKSNQ